MNPRLLAAALGILLPFATAFAQEIAWYPVPEGARPHDVAPAPGRRGLVHRASARARSAGSIPRTGKVEQIPLGEGSAPHGVIVGPDGAAWITDGGLNAIVRVDPATRAVERLPAAEETGYANLNTAAFDGDGTLWFTGQAGIYGRARSRRPASVEVCEAPRGRGPYGITATPSGEVYYASLAGSHIARIDPSTGEATPIEPPTPGQGARRVWSDSKGRIWVSEWNCGPGQRATTRPAGSVAQLEAARRRSRRPTRSMSTSTTRSGSPTSAPTPSSRFDPDERDVRRASRATGAGANVRQILGRPGEVWGAESGTDRLVVIREGNPS